MIPDFVDGGISCRKAVCDDFRKKILPLLVIHGREL